MTSRPAAPLPFTVHATKKGELPISLDKRKWGKLVTRVDNVGGDVDSLCTAIKGALGTGGHSLPGAVEVQGDQREAISAWLVESGCIKGLRRNKAVEVTAVEQDASAGEDAAKERRKPRWDAGRAACSHTASGAEPEGVAGTPAGDRTDPRFQSFCTLWRSWIFWNHDYGMLRERFAQRAQAAGGAEFDSDGGPARSRGQFVSIPPRHAGTSQLLDDALRKLGMAAEQCPLRQSKLERHKQRQGKSVTATTRMEGSGSTALQWPPSRPRCGAPSVRVDPAGAHRVVTHALGGARASGAGGAYDDGRGAAAAAGYGCSGAGGLARKPAGSRGGGAPLRAAANANAKESQGGGRGRGRGRVVGSGLPRLGLDEESAWDGVAEWEGDGGEDEEEDHAGRSLLQLDACLVVE